MRSALFCLGILALLAQPSTAWAKDHYVDPSAGAPTGDGSANSPWRTIQEVIDAGLVESQEWDALPYSTSSVLVPKNAGAPIKAGDTIFLRSGYHGELSISEHYNTAQITIAAEPGQTPTFKAILVRSSANWRLMGLSVSAEFAPIYERKTLIEVSSHGYRGPLHDVIVERCVLSSVSDSSSWSAADWNDRACNGITASGSHVTLRHNILKNVNFGLNVSASDSLVEHNVVENFSGDGMRGLGDHTTFQYNTIKNCYDVNDNHDDGFQSWSMGPNNVVGTGEVVGIVLRGNRIINYEDAQQPLRGTLQGIGCFDGTYVDWVIENNVVITDHWHGITLMGAKNCRIVNNTVLDPNDERPGPAWIRIAADKDGTESEGCVIRNNLAQSFDSEPAGVVEDHNLEYSDPSALFVDAAGYDLHLLASASAAIDQGSSTLAPSSDAEGIPRPQGSEVDIGAYEWTDKPPRFFDAGNDDAAQLDGMGPSSDGGAPSDANGPADDAIAADGAASADSGGPEAVGGCSCRLGATGDHAPGASLATLGLLLLMWRRRSARSS